MDLIPTAREKLMKNIRQIEDAVADYKRGKNDDPEYFASLCEVQRKLYRELERLNYEESN